MPDCFLSAIWAALWSTTHEFTEDAITGEIDDLRRRLARPDHDVEDR